MYDCVEGGIGLDSFVKRPLRGNVWNNGKIRVPGGSVVVSHLTGFRLRTDYSTNRMVLFKKLRQYMGGNVAIGSG